MEFRNFRCLACKELKPETLFSVDSSRPRGRDPYCKDCHRARTAKWKVSKREEHRQAKKIWRANNLNKLREGAARYAAKYPEKILAKNAKRKADTLKRTPKWLTEKDLKEIQDIYLQARLMTEITGTPYHVDHVLPLCGKYVSGLHVPSNLSVIPAGENLKKNNHWRPQ